ncbi:MAG: undecaprenyl-diphosphate phosphatase [Desulfobacterales bacterium]
MEIIQAAVLGLVQGITEFLPISSSGHLVLFQHLFGLTEPHLEFGIAVHIGTLLAVVLFFFGNIRSLVATLVRFLLQAVRRNRPDPIGYARLDLKMAALIGVGCIPTALIGLAFYRISDTLFSSISLVGVMLIITGILLYLTRWKKKAEKTIQTFTLTDALIIGLVQGMAILPGISRSGATIAAAVFLGIRKEIAAEFSFLLSIPAILGAGAFMVKDVVGEPGPWNLNVLLAGSLVSAIVGYFSLYVLVFMIKKGRLHFFAPYCWLLGAAVFIII